MQNVEKVMELRVYGLNLELKIFTRICSSSSP